MLARLIQVDEENTGITDTVYNGPYYVGNASQWSVQSIIDVNTPSAKTFDSGTSELSTLTFPAVAASTGGDYFVIYDTAGLGWAVWLDKSGSDTAPTGAIYAAIPAARKARANISADTTAATVAARVELAFDALTSVPIVSDDSAADGTMTFSVTLHGNTTNAVTKNANDSGSGSIAAVTTTPGVATEVDTANDQVTIPLHVMYEGLKVRLTTTGTLPAGLSTGVDYFIIVVDANTVAFASSLANAQAGTKVDITGEGSNAGVNTVTPTAIAGATIKVQVSNNIAEPTNTDTTAWTDNAAATSITADASLPFSDAEQEWTWMQVVMAITAGSMDIENRVLIRGDAA